MTPDQVFARLVMHHGGDRAAVALLIANGIAQYGPSARIAIPLNGEIDKPLSAAFAADAAAAIAREAARTWSRQDIPDDATGDDMRRARHELGLSQEALAELWNVRQATISAWERSESIDNRTRDALRHLLATR